MKAWVVTDAYEECSTVVFAETRNKARLAALNTDTCEDMCYLEIKPIRFKKADCMYAGRNEMDWHYVNDRRFLAEHGWLCTYRIIYSDCKTCSCRDICDGAKMDLEDKDGN